MQPFPGGKEPSDEAHCMMHFRNLQAAAFLAIASIILLMIWPSIVMAEEPNESQIKTAFIYNFTQFIQWPNRVPTSGEAKMSLCILGDDPLANTLELLKGKATSGGPLSVIRIAKVEDAGRCQIVYVGKSEKDQMKNILKDVRAGVLTIGEMNHFASSGGAINLVVAGNRVSFEINTDATERAGLKISSHLLKLAKIVKDDAR
jgi:hypothetical protein